MIRLINRYIFILLVIHCNLNAQQSASSLQMLIRRNLKLI
jgi:hypothetical protein